MTQIVPLADVDDRLDALRGDALRGDALRGDSLRGGAITIGNFDGVHRGHRDLLRQLRRVADRVGGPAVAVALDPHPATILRPENAPPRLTSIRRRAELMQPLGIDALVVCQTNAEFLRRSAADFYHLLVVDSLAAQAVVEGPNFFFGHNRGGDVETLRTLCEQSGVELSIIEPNDFDGEMISSTRIRRLLAEGNVERATELLGHTHRISGTVVTGARRGREIGFPTANLESIDMVVPASGVYGGCAEIEGKLIDAAIHIGPNPTFESDASDKVEVHLIDYDGDLYDCILPVDFVHRVRDIARFDSSDALVRQLRKDIETVRTTMSQFHTTHTR